MFMRDHVGLYINYLQSSVTPLYKQEWWVHTWKISPIVHSVSSHFHLQCTGAGMDHLHVTHLCCHTGDHKEVILQTLPHTSIGLYRAAMSMWHTSCRQKSIVIITSTSCYIDVYIVAALNIIHVLGCHIGPWGPTRACNNIKQLQEWR